MRKLVFVCLLLLMPVTAWGQINTSVLAVVENGSVQTTGRYFAFGGTGAADNPGFQSEYLSEYSARGSAGFAQNNSFGGTVVTVKEQFEVMKGYGSFETKVGTGLLIDTPREPAEGETQTTPIIDGTLRLNAGGFGGRLSGPGAVLSTFDTSNGLVGKSEAEMTNGQFKAGAVQIIQIGSNEQPIQPPLTIEYQSAHWRFEGGFQAKVEFSFPQ